MDNISDYICGTQQQIQAAYDWLKQLNSQSLEWAFAIDAISKARKAERATRIAVMREAALSVQRTFEALQETDVLWAVLQPCIWEGTAEIWDQASDTCIAISSACAQGSYNTQEFVVWAKANIAFKDLLDTLRELLGIALEQTLVVHDQDASHNANLNQNDVVREIMLPAVLSSSELAEELRRWADEKGKQQPTHNAVEVFLRRYRDQFPDCAVETEKDGRRRSDPKWLYRTADVWLPLREHFRL